MVMCEAMLDWKQDLLTQKSPQCLSSSRGPTAYNLLPVHSVTAHFSGIHMIMADTCVGWLNGESDGVANAGSKTSVMGPPHTDVC